MSPSISLPSAWFGETQRATSRHCTAAMVSYDHTTTAMHEIGTPALHIPRTLGENKRLRQQPLRNHGILK